MNINGIQHLGLPTLDLAATIDFFRSLGFAIDWQGENKGVRVCFLARDGVVVEAYDAGRAAGIRGAIDHVALDTDNLAGWVAFLRQGGYSIVEGPNFLPYYEHGVAYISIQGPNAEVVEFNQRFRSAEEAEAVCATLGLQR